MAAAAGKRDDGGLARRRSIALRSEWAAYEPPSVGPGLGNDDETRAFTWAVLPDLAANCRAAA